MADNGEEDLLEVGLRDAPRDDAVATLLRLDLGEHLRQLDRLRGLMRRGVGVSEGVRG